MKRYDAGLGLLVGLGLLLGGCGSQAREADGSGIVAGEDDRLSSESVVLTIHGMSCPLCATNVDNSLLDVPGVKSVQLDMSTGEATLMIDPQAGVTRRQLAEAVDRSGFTLVGIAAR